MEALLMLTSVDQCVSRQRELEAQLGATKDKDQRLPLKLELDAVLERMRELKAERKAKAVADAKAAKLSRELPKATKSEAGAASGSATPLSGTAGSSAKPDPEVIVLRRPARPPSRPPEAVPQSREPRPFADLRAGIAAETRRR